MSMRQDRTIGAVKRSGSTEAFRSLRSTLKFSAGGQPIRSVLVVDIDRDNPSGVADRLAQAFSEAGDDCVLIDTNTRNATERVAGFLDLIAGTTTVEALRPGRSEGALTRIGPGESGTPDALASDAFSDALSGVLPGAGFAILSAAPLPKFADAVAIAPRVDAVILVVTSGGTRRPRAIEARDALDRVGANILGVVMVEPKRRWFW